MQRRERGGSLGALAPGEMRLERLLTEFSFLRIAIDYVAVPTGNEATEGLARRGALFGFTLQYSFPCPDGVSSSLRHKVRLRASSFTSTAIYFRHKRVNLVRLNPDVIPFWSRATLVLELDAQLNVLGKFSTRPLARCTIPLDDLLLPPFAISRDFPFVGNAFDGTALIKIDLGSQQRALMERLERWRSSGVENELAVLEGQSRGREGERGPPRNARSRSNSRCRSRCSSRPSSRGGEEKDDDVFTPVGREQGSHSNSRQFDPPCIYGSTAPAPFRPLNHNHTTVDTATATRGGRPTSFQPSAPSYAPLPSLGPLNGGVAVERNERGSREGSTHGSTGSYSMPPPSVCIRLTIHAASGLPMPRDSRGLQIAPSAFISVRGRDGEMRSPVRRSNRSPPFDWTCTFYVSGERRNVVVKVLHAGEEGEDVPLGFISLALPMATVERADYELIDLSGDNRDAATLTLSVSTTTSRPPSKVDDPFRAPVPVMRGHHEGMGRGGARASSENMSRSASQRSLSDNGAASTLYRPIGDYSRTRSPLDDYHGRGRLPLPPRRRSPSPPDILILETREEIERRLRRNMSDLDQLIRNIERR